MLGIIKYIKVNEIFEYMKPTCCVKCSMREENKDVTWRSATHSTSKEVEATLTISTFLHNVISFPLGMDLMGSRGSPPR